MCLITNKSPSAEHTTSPHKSNTSNYKSVCLVILPHYLLTYSVTQNADAVLTSRDKITNAILELSLSAKYLVDD